MALSVAVAISWGCPPPRAVRKRTECQSPLGGWPDTWRPRSTSTTGASCNPQERGRQKRRRTALRTAPTGGLPPPAEWAPSAPSRAPPSAGPAPPRSRTGARPRRPAARPPERGPHPGCPPGGGAPTLTSAPAAAHRLPRGPALRQAPREASVAPRRPLPLCPAPKRRRAGAPARRGPPHLVQVHIRPRALGKHLVHRRLHLLAQSRRPTTSGPLTALPCVPRRGKFRRWRAADSMVPPPPAPSPPAPFGESRLRRTFNSMVPSYIRPD